MKNHLLILLVNSYSTS